MRCRFIDITSPKGDWRGCLRPEEVAEAFEAAGSPPIAATVRFRDDVPHARIEAVADCIQAQLGPGNGAVAVVEREWPPVAYEE